MDKSWIELRDRTSAEFRHGLESFLEFSYTNLPADSKIKCPCVDCRNSRKKTRSKVLDDVICKGFLPGYTNWVHQGEQPNYLRRYLSELSSASASSASASGVPGQEGDHDGERDDMQGLLHDAFASTLHSFDDGKDAKTPSETHIPPNDNPDTHFDKNTEKFFNILKHAEVELFPGCKSFTFLSFIVRLLHVKSLCQWSNNSFTMLLEVLKEAFQHIEMFPNSYREAWKVIQDLGLDYQKIHACPKDCMLYWKKTEKDTECKHCKTPRYKTFKRLSGSEVLEQLDGMETKFGKYEPPKVGRKRKQIADDNTSSSVCRYNWKKVSIFFQLPYWKENLVPHNLDIMHIEKNVLDNILWTLLGTPGKTKDNYASRLDLQEMGIRKSLHPSTDGGSLPPSDTTLSKAQKEIFLKVLKYVKVPDGYSSNISKCVQLETRNIFGLKSHDCHILMQELLPIALRRSVPKHVCKAIIGLCDIFKQLYSKVHSVHDFEALEVQVAKVLCRLEKNFPPSFFDVMEHLPIHLPEEAKLAGPVQPRSMYPIERYLCTLKKYVRSKSHPEGSIAEGYLAEECMNFCAMYLSDVESKLNRPNRNDEGDENIPTQEGRPLGKEEVRKLDDIEWIQAHRYVINNLSIVDKFKGKHLKELKRTNRRMKDFEIQKLQNDIFHNWFKSHVRQLSESASSGNVIDRDIQFLAAGPSKWVRQYTGYVINGLRFHTKKRENRRKTQNSGVFSSIKTESFSSCKDKNPKSGDLPFYGVLQDIIELRYSNDLRFVMFKCDWVNQKTGLMVDEFDFTLVNFGRLLYPKNREGDEPFILASQVKQQAWYVQDPVDPDWHVALKMSPRALINVDPEFNEFEHNEDGDFFVLEGEEEGEIGNADINGVEVENLDGSNIPDASSEDEMDYFSSENDVSSDDDNFFDNITSSSENESD